MLKVLEYLLNGWVKYIHEHEYAPLQESHLRPWDDATWVLSATLRTLKLFHRNRNWVAKINLDSVDVTSIFGHARIIGHGRLNWGGVTVNWCFTSFGRGTSIGYMYF